MSERGWFYDLLSSRWGFWGSAILGATVVVLIGVLTA